MNKAAYINRAGIALTTFNVSYKQEIPTKPLVAFLHKIIKENVELDKQQVAVDSKRLEGSDLSSVMRPEPVDAVEYTHVQKVVKNFQDNLKLTGNSKLSYKFLCMFEEHVNEAVEEESVRIIELPKEPDESALTYLDKFSTKKMAAFEEKKKVDEEALKKQQEAIEDAKHKYSLFLFVPEQPFSRHAIFVGIFTTNRKGVVDFEGFFHSYKFQKKDLSLLIGGKAHSFLELVHEYSKDTSLPFGQFIKEKFA